MSLQCVAAGGVVSVQKRMREARRSNEPRYRSRASAQDNEAPHTPVAAGASKSAVPFTSPPLALPSPDSPAVQQAGDVAVRADHDSRLAEGDDVGESNSFLASSPGQAGDQASTGDHNHDNSNRSFASPNATGVSGVHWVQDGEPTKPSGTPNGRTSHGTAELAMLLSARDLEVTHLRARLDKACVWQCGCVPVWLWLWHCDCGGSCVPVWLWLWDYGCGGSCVAGCVAVLVPVPVPDLRRWLRMASAVSRHYAASNHKKYRSCPSMRLRALQVLLPATMSTAVAGRLKTSYFMRAPPTSASLTNCRSSGES